MDQDFAITRIDRDGATLIALQGELDLSTAPSLRDAIHESAREKGVVVDLQDLTFMDSAGIGTLLRAHQELSQEGRPFKLVITQRRFLQLLEITGLRDIFEIAPSLDDAFSAL